MANTISGTKGYVILAGGPLEDVDIHWFEWSAQYRRDIWPDSGYADSGNSKKKMGGMHDLQGTAVGRMVADKLALVSDMQTHNAQPTGSWSLQSDNTTSATRLEFTGIMSLVGYRHAKVGQAIVTCTFESHGDITETEGV